MVIWISRVATGQQNIYYKLKVGFPSDRLPKQNDSYKTKKYITELAGHHTSDTSLV